MDTSNLNNPNLLEQSDTNFTRPPGQSLPQLFDSIDNSSPTNISNDITTLNIKLLIRGYGKTSLNYNLGMTFPDLLNQKIYFPFKVSLTIDDLVSTLVPSTYVETPTKKELKELITLFTTTELISEVIKNAKKRIFENFPLENDYNKYIVNSFNKSIQNGILKNNLSLLNDLLFLNDSDITFNKKRFVIDDSKELKPEINNFKEQLSKKTPINSILTCDGILFVSPILDKKQLLSSVTRLNINLIIRGQRKGIVKDYNPGMSFPSLKNKSIYFPFTIKLTTNNLIKALDLNPNIKPSNNDLISVFTKPGLLRLAIRDSIKSGQKSVSTIDEAVNNNIIENNLNLINDYLFSPKTLITIYGHNYTIHSSEGISPEINRFKNLLISGKSPLSIKLDCNVILNILDTDSPSNIEFQRLSCQMRKDLIIQDLEEVLGTEIERDIKKDIKYLKRAPAISRYEYYKKKGILYPEYPSGYFPYFPGYFNEYPSSSLLTTRKRRKPITESIYRRGPISTTAFTTRRPTTSSTLDTFTSPESISPSRFEERPTSKLEQELARRREIEKQRFYPPPVQYPYPYPFPYGAMSTQRTYSKPKQTKKIYTSSILPSKTSAFPYQPYPYPLYPYPPNPFVEKSLFSKKINQNKTKKLNKGGNLNKKKYNRTIKK